MHEMLQAPMNLTSLLIDLSLLLGGVSWKRTFPTNKESLQLRRFNLALLPRLDLTITGPVAADKTKLTHQANANEPHTTARSFGIPTNDGDK
jgi:hypothetical protein